MAKDSTAAITEADVEHVAALAALALTPDEVERFGRDLADILGYVAELNALDTAHITPLTQISELVHEGAPGGGSLRLDEPQSSLARELVMKEAPATDGTFFKVPKVIDR